MYCVARNLTQLIIDCFSWECFYIMSSSTMYEAQLNANLHALKFLDTAWIYKLNADYQQHIPYQALLNETIQFHKDLNTLLRDANDGEDDDKSSKGDVDDSVRLLSIEEKKNIKGALDYMKLRFYQETWEMEQETTLSEGETYEYILSIVEENNDMVIKECDVVIYKKIKNIHQAFIYQQINYITESLSIDHILQINRMISHELSEYGGKYRITHVTPSGYKNPYIPPEFITKRLEILIKFWNNHFSIIKDSFETCLKLATMFFCEFLRIHPFINGNGRTARLIMQWMLRDVCFIPFSVNSPKHIPFSFQKLPFKIRHTYLEILQNAQMYGGNDYDVLATYILSACHYSSKTLQYLL